MMIAWKLFNAVAKKKIIEINTKQYNYLYHVTKSNTWVIIHVLIFDIFYIETVKNRLLLWKRTHNFFLWI